MIVHKIVRAIGEKYYSAFICDTGIEYKVGEVAKPSMGHLFAFTQLNFAMDMAYTISADQRPMYQIWEAETAQTFWPTTTTIPSAFVMKEGLRAWWERGIEPSATKMIPIPQGTIYCSDLRLIKCVKKWTRKE